MNKEWSPYLGMGLENLKQFVRWSGRLLGPEKQIAISLKCKNIFTLSVSNVKTSLLRLIFIKSSRYFTKVAKCSTHNAALISSVVNFKSSY